MCSGLSVYMRNCYDCVVNDPILYHLVKLIQAWKRIIFMYVCIWVATAEQRCIFSYVFGVTVGVSIAGSDERRHVLKPFSVLDETCQGKPVTALAAPSLVDDYCRSRQKSWLILISNKLSPCLNDTAGVPTPPFRHQPS